MANNNLIIISNGSQKCVRFCVTALYAAPAANEHNWWWVRTKEQKKKKPVAADWGTNRGTPNREEVLHDANLFQFYYSVNREREKAGMGPPRGIKSDGNGTRGRLWIYEYYDMSPDQGSSRIIKIMHVLCWTDSGSMLGKGRGLEKREPTSFFLERISSWN